MTTLVSGQIREECYPKLLLGTGTINFTYFVFTVSQHMLVNNLNDFMFQIRNLI